MKRVLVSLMLLLALLCMCMPAGAEGDGVSLEVEPRKMLLHQASEPLLSGLVSDPTDGTPVLILPVRKSCEFSISVLPRNLKNRKVTITAEDETVVRIRNNGITGLAPGETLMTIATQADPTISVIYRVLVVQPVSRISVTAAEKSMAAGETIALSTSVLPEDATIQSVLWSSSDERIATVDEDGTVHGVSRGNVRIIATSQDGGNVRANISIKVTQNAQEITLNQDDVTIDVGKTAVLRATVLPKNTDDKNVIWSSSDESIATVNSQGRITGVSLGECEIICTSKTAGEVQARATVHIQKPVRSITFGAAPVVYAKETAQLGWTIEPADATNPALKLTSANEKILTVSDDGTLTGIQAGETYVNAITTDGSNRRARIRVKVLQHVEGVHMKRQTAYIDVKEGEVTGAVFEPETATNQNMTWESADPSVAMATATNKSSRVKIVGVSQGETVVTGITEDGGFKTSITVKVGDWDHALQLKDAQVKGTDVIMKIRNNSTLHITSITAEISVFDADGNPVPCNSKDDSNTFKMVYKHPLDPGETTTDRYWKTVNFKTPESLTVSEYEIKITQYQIDDDWIKTIRKWNQPSQKCPVLL